ncbi:MAG: hypothetical protein ACXWRE_12880 [Pseudobdellovibrionaceae bacterium]
MKTKKFYLSGALFLGLFLSSAEKSLAMSEISFSGELDAALTLKQLPTRDQGVTAFSLPYLKLDIEAPLKDNNEIFLELESAEYRDATSKRFDTQLKEAYLSLTSLFPPGGELRYGLIPDLYIEIQREQWDYDYWGVNSSLPLIKYKYTSWADLGGMYQGEFADDWGHWALSVTNGEGMQSDEIGPRKQAQIIIGLTKIAPFYAMFSYVYGGYDNFDDSFNKKTRLLAHLSYEFSKGLLALEYYATQDPADAITAGAMAGGVDVSALHATSVEGQGATLLGRLGLNENTNLFLRADWLSPVKQEKEKNLKALSTGISYDSSEDIRWALAYEYTDYSNEFAASIRDQSQLVLATKVIF